MAEYTQEELANAQAIVAAENDRVAKEAAARREAYLPPVRDLVHSDGWAETVAALTKIKTELAEDGLLSVHVNALVEIMPRLAAVAG